MKQRHVKNIIKSCLSMNEIKKTFELSEQKAEYLRNQVFIENTVNENILLSRESKVIYDRMAAKSYLEAYAENPNSNNYPYFKNADCANFISQALHAGGMDTLGTSWNSYSSWFCNTTKQNELTKISLSWRSARFFRKHWGNENGVGSNRAAGFTKITVKQFMDNFDNMYNSLDIGDVIQYGDPKNNDYTYHTQMIHEKGFNLNINRNDMLVAQHTANKKNVSLYSYLSLFTDKNIRYLYVYRI